MNTQSGVSKLPLLCLPPKNIQRRNRFTIFALFWVISLIACSKQSNVSDLEKQFATVVPIEDMNKSLIAALDSRDTVFQSSSKIDLSIYNQSPNYLYFTNDTHVQLLASPDHLTWKEVTNGMTYAVPSMTLSPKGTILLDDHSVRVLPILEPSFFSNDTSGIPLRIVIIGEIVKGESHTGQLVGAFVDVIIKP